MNLKIIEKRVEDLEGELDKRALDNSDGVPGRIVFVPYVRGEGGEPEPALKEPYDPADFIITQHPRYEKWYPKYEGWDKD